MIVTRPTVKALILATVNFDVSANLIIFCRNLGVFTSYYTEKLLYSNSCGPLFSGICQGSEIQEIKGMRKERVLQ